MPNQSTPLTQQPQPHRAKNALPNVHPTNSLILQSGKVYKIQKIRQRKILSCIPCHQRKIKCFREKPICSNCERLAVKNPSKNTEILNACQYFVNDKKKNLKKQGKTDIIELSNKANSEPIIMNKDDDQLEQQQQGGSYSPPSVSSQSPELHSSTHTSPSYTEERQTDLYQVEFKEEEDQSPLQADQEPQDEQVQDQNSDQPSFDQDEFDGDLDILIQEKQNEENQPNEQIPQEIKYYTELFSRKFKLIINSIPSKDRSDELLNNFQNSIHSILPIFDIDSFLKKYDEFWYCGLFLQHNLEKLFQYYVYYKDNTSTCPNEINDFLFWYNKSNCNLNPNNIYEFCILLFVIYYSSAASETYQLPSEQINLLQNEVNKYYEVFNKFNSKNLNNPKTMSLITLQLNILLQSISNLKNGKSLINIVKILRICQFYQLNRDPVIFHNLKDQSTVQIRRIVWWQIFQLDNLVSFFLNLSPIIKLNEFDTALPIENLAASASKIAANNSRQNYNIYYMNSNFRFSLVVNDLIKLSNGLNLRLKNNDINDLKFKINDLYISCYSSKLKLIKIEEPLINKLEQIADNNDELQFNIELELNKISYFKKMLSLLSDKALIMLQKKILIIPYSMSLNHFPNNNLNFILFSTSQSNYNYTNLSINLLPSLLHYINVFIDLSNFKMNRFNWQLKNFIPIDELILLLTILVTNLINGFNQLNYTNNINKDINLKIYLIEKTINCFKLNWKGKLSSLNKLINIVDDIWLLTKLRFNLNLQTVNVESNKFPVPQPISINENVSRHQEQQTQQQHMQQNQQQYQQQHQQQQMSSTGSSKYTSVSCSEVAPRTLSLATSNNFTRYPGSFYDLSSETESKPISSTTTTTPSSATISVMSTSTDATELSTTKAVPQSLSIPTLKHHHHHQKQQLQPSPTAAMSQNQMTERKPTSSLTTPVLFDTSSNTYSSTTLNTGEVKLLLAPDNYYSTTTERSSSSASSNSAGSGVKQELHRADEDEGYCASENVDEAATTTTTNIDNKPMLMNQLANKIKHHLENDNSNEPNSEPDSHLLSSFIPQSQPHPSQSPQPSTVTQSPATTSRNQTHSPSLSQQQQQTLTTAIDHTNIQSIFPFTAEDVDDDEYQEGWINLGVGNNGTTTNTVSPLDNQDNQNHQQDYNFGNGLPSVSTSSTIDDFHFYRGLKNDVLNLFKMIITA